ncbi:MAG: hypothetical protein SFZ23_14630 [Planctomycetota bacterium]|nr:hypothetical protein [Planctomycetota bacterium]
MIVLSLIIAGGSVLLALFFGVGRGKLLSQLAGESVTRMRLEDELAKIRKKAEQDHLDAIEATDVLKRRIHEHAAATAEVQQKLDRMIAERQGWQEKYVAKIGELEGVIREKDAQLAKQEREFADRVARLNAELTGVLSQLSHGDRNAA